MVRTQAELLRVCDKHGVEEPDKATDGICIQADFSSGRTQFILGWMVKDVSVLAHEATHLAQFILIRAGIDPRDSNGETMAYLVGFLVDKCLKVSKS
jgi:hypothetical protein